MGSRPLKQETFASSCSQQDTNAFILSEEPFCEDTLLEETLSDPTNHAKDVGKERHESEAQDEPRIGKKLTKSQQRKLRKIQEEKEKRLKRQKILETLSQNQIGADELNLLRSTSSRGQHDTKKEIRKRALLMERAGIEVPLEMKDVLYSGRVNSKQDMQDDSSSGFVSDEQEDIVSHETEQMEQNSLGNTMKIDALGTSDSDDRSSDHDSKENNKNIGKQVQDDILARARQEIYEAQEEQRCAENDSDSDINGTSRPRKLALLGVQRKVVTVQRTPDIEEGRSSLPIIGMEQEIMEAVSENDVVVLCGETGCGKTTQLPQFLYEAGYTFMKNGLQDEGIIGVTQPRRVAAVSTAHRVSQELGGKIGGLVGYHVRYDRKLSLKTKIQFMTDGILLRELQDDFLLKKYNVIIVDEAHERSLNTDVLLGMLSRIVALRRQLFDESHAQVDVSKSILPLKLIIMSATLRIGDFVENKKLFKIPPPVINIQARQYPVAVHFQKRTEIDDYVGAAYKKTCQIHRRLPDGGVLVFLTGQREVETLCSKLRCTFNKETKIKKKYEDLSSPELDTLDGLDQNELQWDQQEELSEGDDDFQESDLEEEIEEVVEVMNGDIEDYHEQLKLENIDGQEASRKVWVLPLYAMLRPDQQAQVFKPVPEGHRLIVVATNIAETSLTIPGIRYVVDAGRSKQRLVDSSSGLARYDVRWISKASADQRAGRSGRMGPGHCYRIYSSAVFNDMFPKFSPPEIINTALEGVVLLLKSIGVDNVMNFPFPSPPDPSSLSAAEKCLVNLSAINKNNGSLTDIGKAMANLPIEPRHSRLLLEVLTNQDITKKDEALVNTLITFAIRLTAAMSLESPFINPSSLQDHVNEDKEEGLDESAAKELRKQKATKLFASHAKLRLPDSDHLSAMNALCAFEESGGTYAFCKDNFLIFKHLREGLQLTKQLERILKGSRSALFDGNVLDASRSSRPKLTTSIIIALKRSIIAGWGDQISKRVRSTEYLARKKSEGSRTRAVRYEAIALDEDVFLHPSSFLYSASPSWLIYSNIIETEKRAYMVGLTAIEPQWIHAAVPQLTNLSSPCSTPVPRYVPQNDCVMAWHEATYGPLQWELPPVLLPHPDKRERAALFAISMLDGTVIPRMKAFLKYFVAPPSIMANSEMRVHRRISDLIAKLDSHHIYSKYDLCLAWRSDKQFLKGEITAWVKKQFVTSFVKEWDTIPASIIDNYP